MPEYMEGYAEGTNPITIEKLKNGEFSIQKTLDLHGLSIDDAKVSLEEFIVDSIVVSIVLRLFTEGDLSLKAFLF